MKEKLYLNVERLYNELLEILTEERDNWIDDSNREFMLYEFSDCFLNERCEQLAYEFNNNIGDYLNKKNHKIDGNLCNVDYDYPYHIKGEFNYDFPLVNAMIARLNAGEESEQADADRDWLVDWFWEAFGTFGIKYNFNEYVADRLYEFEHSTEKEYDLEFETIL